MPPVQFLQEGDFSLDSTIRILGTPTIDSPLQHSTFADDRFPELYLDSEIVEELETPRTLAFEGAGPRRKIYFDARKTKCAIVTCGGLCPGINDVIRAIVMEAVHAYNVPSVLGIRYGLEGFIPEYNHDVWELTPHTV